MDSLSKYIAQSGFCSRRHAVELIAAGKVTVNGTKIVEPGFKIAENAVIKIGNKVIKTEEKIYILLNKPRGYITTSSDEMGRRTVLDLIQDAPKARIYPVGRLDQDTTGLLVLTNDGELAQQLAHPKFEVQKTYAVTLDKPLSQEDRIKIQYGLTLKDGRVQVDALEYFTPRNHRKIKVVLHSGKNRIVRRIFAHLGYHVMHLDRISYAGLNKKNLSVGHWRLLTKKEIASLKK